MSVAGGLPRAIDRAVVHGCEALQIFAKNASQWRGRTIPPEEVCEFRAKLNATRIAPAVSHASYLINLASADRGLRRQSIEAMGDELDRAEALGLLGVVLHPGCYTIGSESDGLELIADALLDLLRERRRGRTMVLLEHTAGQGTALGCHLRTTRVDRGEDRRSSTHRHLPRHVSPPRLGLRHRHGGRVCRDVSAVWAAGRVRSPEGLPYERFETPARQPRRPPRAHR